MVALIGFKLKLATAALPVLFAGSILYLSKSNKKIHGAGQALAGFSLIFIGIQYLQTGLEGYRDVIDLSDWNAASFSGRLVLLLIGVAITLLTQSSSATVATAVTALNSGILDLPQAASVIIGADIGTTFTAAIATIGGTTASKRTGFAHVIYNVMTGVMAFLLLPIYLFFWEKFGGDTINKSPEVIAVSFHSFFNIFGVVVAIPFTARFGRFIENLFPEKVPKAIAPFDKELLVDNEAATGGLIVGSMEAAKTILGQTSQILSSSQEFKLSEELREEILRSVQEGRTYAIEIGNYGIEDIDIDSERIFACIHILDHVKRLTDRCSDKVKSKSAKSQPQLSKQGEALTIQVQQLIDELTAQEVSSELIESLNKASQELEEDQSAFRKEYIKKATECEIDANQLDEALGAHRWLRRVTYHISRIAHYSTLLKEKE